MAEAPALFLLVILHLSVGLTLWRWLSNANPSMDDLPDRIDHWFAAFSLAFIVTGWLSVVLAEIGRFTLVGLIVPWTVLSGWSWWRTRRRARPEPSWGPWPSRAALAGLTLWLAGAGWLFLRPHEYILGGADAGVYVNLGANIERTGSLLINDPLLADLPPALHPVLLRALPPTEATPYYLFPGFYVPGEPIGLVIPQFYPMYPAFLAAAYAVGGVETSLLMSGLFALWGAFSLFLLARRLAGPVAAALTLAGITLSGLQIWFSRYPTTETLAQALLWTGVFALSMWWPAREERRSWGLLAGLAWGALLLTRIDMIFILVLPLLLALAATWQGRLTRTLLWFLAPLALLAAHMLVHALWQSWPYFLNTFGAGIDLLRRNPVATAAAVAAALAALAAVPAWARWQGRRHVASALRAPQDLWRRLLPRIVAGFILALGVYGWFIRPGLARDVASWFSWYAEEQVAVLDQENLVRLGWYLSPIGVWLGIVGAAARAWRPPTRQQFGWVVFMAVGGFFSVFYLWRLQNNPVQIYGMRRYVPAVMPFFIILAAWLIAWLGRYGKGWNLRSGEDSLGRAGTVRGWAALAVSLLWLLGLGWGARGLVRQQDARGLSDQVLALGRSLPADSVLLFGDPAPVGLGDFLGTPLQFLSGHHAFTVRDADWIQEQRLEALLADTVSDWRSQDHAVYWVGDPAAAAQLGLLTRPGPTVAIRATILEGTSAHRPQALAERGWTVQLNEVVGP